MMMMMMMMPPSSSPAFQQETPPLPKAVEPKAPGVSFSIGAPPAMKAFSQLAVEGCTFPCLSLSLGRVFEVAMLTGRVAKDDGCPSTSSNLDKSRSFPLNVLQ